MPAAEANSCVYLLVVCIYGSLMRMVCVSRVHMAHATGLARKPGGVAAQLFALFNTALVLRACTQAGDHLARHGGTRVNRPIDVPC